MEVLKQMEQGLRQQDRLEKVNLVQLVVEFRYLVRKPHQVRNMNPH